MDGRIPSNVQDLLQNYVRLLKTEFEDALFGVYIYGSLALDSYNVKNSNIDFITIFKKTLSGSDISRIQSIHDRLEKMNPVSYKMEGEYVTIQDTIIDKQHTKYPYFAYNKYQGNIEIKSFTWFQLKQCGIAVYGEDFNKVNVDIDWENVKNELSYSLNEYWPKKVNKNFKLLSDTWVSLIVLTLCRIHYTLENQSVISKAGAGRHALEILDEEWHQLINEAIRIQTNSSKESLFQSRIKRLGRIKEFVPYMVSFCNSHGAIS